VMNFGFLSAMTALFAIAVMIESILYWTKWRGQFIAGSISPTTNSIAAYQIALGAISGVLALIAAVLDVFGPLPMTIAFGFALFQTLWWMSGAIVVTYFGSYTTSYLNWGYFGTWGAFIASLISLIYTIRVAFEAEMISGYNNTYQGMRKLFVTRYHSRKSIAFLAFASAVEMGAAIAPCIPTSICLNYNAVAIVAGVVSLAICLFLLLGGTLLLTERPLKLIAGFLVIWWIVFGGIITFGDQAPFSPFYIGQINTFPPSVGIVPTGDTVGNGFFATLAAILASISFYCTLPPLMAPVQGVPSLLNTTPADGATSGVAPPNVATTTTTTAATTTTTKV